MLATMSSGIVWNVVLYTNCKEYSSSAIEITLTRLVPLSMLMVWLPVGGTTTRMAWRKTMRLIASRFVIPRASAASIWPVSTDKMPALMISDMYAPSLSPSARTAATRGVTRWLTSAETKLGPKGIPSDTRGTNEAMLYQKI